ncbi:hypothetical protein D9M71_155700 [compost metagenome]
MTEDAVVWQTALERLFEGVNLIDTLADERAVLEQVLINIRDGTGIGVDAGIATEQAGVCRASRAGQADPDAWLKDRVAADNLSAVFIEHWVVQGVHHGADALAPDVAGQQGIGVQCDDKANRRQGFDVANDHCKAVLPFAPQQGIELCEFPAFAFMPHPYPLGRAPVPGPVQQEKPVDLAIGIFFVERLDQFARQGKQRGILRHHLGRGIHEITEQCEVQVGIAIGQEAHFQAFGQCLDVAGIGEHRRYRHQRTRLGRYAFAVVQAGQYRWGYREGHQPVDQADGQAAGHQ